MSATTVGPLGFPVTDTQAFNLDTILKSLPQTKEYEYRKTTFHKAATEISAPERSDVSWISTETPDRYNHVVIANGMNDSQFALNPIVTLNHCYSMPAIGRSLWRKKMKGDVKGIKAKTVYPQRPNEWKQDDEWAPDKVFALIQSGLLNGKSIGWFPLKIHWPDAKEQLAKGWKDNVMVIDEWMLVEYAVGTIPVNPETVIETVSKLAPISTTLTDALGWDRKLFETPITPAHVKFTSLDQIEQSLRRQIEKIDTAQMIQDVIARKCGRV